MVKKIYIFALLFFPVTLFCFSSKGEVHKNNSILFCEDISGLNYNPALLSSLAMRKAEFLFTTSEKFKYDYFAIGYYITRGFVFSKYYLTSFNLGAGILKKDVNYENFQLGFGGYLVKSFRYGITFDYTKNLNQKYLNLKSGFIMELFKWSSIGFTLFNLVKEGFYFLSALKIDITDDFHIGVGGKFESLKKVTDYSFTTEINLIKNFYLASGYHKNSLSLGMGINFSYNTENLFISCDYDKNLKKWSKVIFSYRHKFLNPFYKEVEIVKKEKEIKTSKEEKKKISEKEILVLQEKYLKWVEIYYKEERFDDALDMIDRILELDSNTVYAEKAKKLKEGIKMILEK